MNQNVIGVFPWNTIQFFFNDVIWILYGATSSHQNDRAGGTRRRKLS